ncbi:MAG: sulfatase [Bacteroidales bacterium]
MSKLLCFSNPALVILLLLAACVRDSSVPGEGKEPTRPNILIILADDLGYADLGVSGAPRILTPRIDKMATEGVRMTSFYTESLCSPTRSALLTGCYAHRIGIDQVFWPDSEEGLNPDEITIAELLSEAGYSTALIGKWHLGHRVELLPTNQGFDYYFGLPYSNDMGPDARREGFGPLPLMRNTEVIEQGPDLTTITKRYTEEAIKFISEHKDNPFFVILAHTFPHVPLYAGKEFQGTSSFGLYGDVVQEIDWSTGALLDKLKELGLAENTIVIFTSDNGPWLQKGDHGGLATPLRDGKGTSWEGGHRVPAIFRWPESIPAGTVIDGLSSIMDLYPTLARWAGAELPSDRVIDGKDHRAASKRYC